MRCQGRDAVEGGKSTGKKENTSLTNERINNEQQTENKQRNEPTRQRQKERKNTQSERKREYELTLDGPVAGRPRVMLGSEGDVYRDSWLKGPSRPASLWAREAWKQRSTQSEKHTH